MYRTEMALRPEKTAVPHKETTHSCGAAENKRNRLKRTLEAEVYAPLEGVELLSNAALLMSGSVLAEDTLAHGLVDGGNGDLCSNSSSLLITGSSGSLELLYVGLQQRLVGLVDVVSSLGDKHSLLGRFNVRHEKHLLHISNY